ncbi:hypothetical protein MRB53_040401 [Persea americana]|nr:hypothetical protein MRB53_040401 [Persea americana]
MLTRIIPKNRWPWQSIWNVTSPDQHLTPEERRHAWLDPPPPFSIDHINPADLHPTSTRTVSTLLPPLLADRMQESLSRPILTHEQAFCSEPSPLPQGTARPPSQRRPRPQQHGLEWTDFSPARLESLRYAALDHLESIANASTNATATLLSPGFTASGDAIPPGTTGHRHRRRKPRHPRPRHGHDPPPPRQQLHRPDRDLHYPDEQIFPWDVTRLQTLSPHITVREAPVTPWRDGAWKNYELKATAILLASFDNILYLDSDDLPLADVTPLFTSPLFTDPKGGNVVIWARPQRRSSRERHPPPPRPAVPARLDRRDGTAADPQVGQSRVERGSAAPRRAYGCCRARGSAGAVLGSPAGTRIHSGMRLRLLRVPYTPGAEVVVCCGDENGRGRGRGLARVRVQAECRRERG